MLQHVFAKVRPIGGIAAQPESRARFDDVVRLRPANGVPVNVDRLSSDAAVAAAVKTVHIEMLVVITRIDGPLPALLTAGEDEIAFRNVPGVGIAMPCD